jgi:hypothetical protein
METEVERENMKRKIKVYWLQTKDKNVTRTTIKENGCRDKYNHTKKVQC